LQQKAKLSQTNRTLLRIFVSYCTHKQAISVEIFEFTCI